MMQFTCKTGSPAFLAPLALFCKRKRANIALLLLDSPPPPCNSLYHRNLLQFYAKINPFQAITKRKTPHRRFVMNKILSIAAIVALVTTLSFAQEGDLKFGIRAGFNLYDLSSGNKEMDKEIDLGMGFGGGIAVNIPL
jgi:hypothetical protein